MKKYILILISIFFFSLTNVLPQEQPKSSEIFYLRNQIGIQLNPFIDENLIDGLIMKIVGGVRYGYKITKSILLGVEAFGDYSYFFNQSNPVHFYSYKIGLFSRYSIPAERRVQGFLEVSPYYGHSYRSGTLDLLEKKTDKFGVYAAPGISLYSKNKKFSLDLYYKFSTLTFINGKKSVFSYKINFNF